MPLTNIPPNPLHHPDIWKQMSYTPPRGACAHKPTLLTPTCACLRFMIHPLKAGSTFDCDGCGHHASFHRMENRADEEVVERWRQREAMGSGEREEERARKSRRVVQGAGGGRGAGMGDGAGGGAGAGAGVGAKRKLLAVGGGGAETETAGEEDGDGVEVVRVGVVARSRRVGKG